MLLRRSAPLRLRIALCGGEPLAPDLAERLHECSSQVWNLYGPTETTIWSTAARLKPGHHLTVGLPLANTHVYVLGADRRPVHLGETGEVAIAGAGVSLGYHGLPEATADRFRIDPVRHVGRVYLTGDRARMREDGSIELLGRNDDQIKIHGYRLELGEIEATLVGDEGVGQAAVVALGGKDEPWLCAFVVLENLDAHHSIQSRLLHLLPRHAVPTTIRFVDALPFLVSGKIDRAALRVAALKNIPERPLPKIAQSLEGQIVALWSEVLKVDRIEPDADFFGIGGRSLDAATVVAKLELLTGEFAFVNELYSHPRLADFCATYEGPAPDSWQPSRSRDRSRGWTRHRPRR